MVWQFGEIGYDVNIDYDCRVCNKPIRWDYFTDLNRRHLYDVFSALIHLRQEHEVFGTDDFSWSLNNAAKRINLNHATMNVVVLGNFAVTPRDIDPQFQSTGWWYEYFSGDSLSVTDVNDLIALQAGEYRIYTSKRLNAPDITVGIYSLPEEEEYVRLLPNPTSDFIYVYFKNAEDLLEIEIFDITGSPMLNTKINKYDMVNVETLKPGLYIIKIRSKNSTHTDRLIVN